MKRILPFLAVLILFSGIKTFASHDLGGEISYQQVSPNNYQVTFKHYRDCAGSVAPVTTILSAKAPGCNAGRNITLNLVGQKSGRPYGPAIPVSCNTTTIQNYQISIYTGMLSFSASESACTDWVLSWTECCRPNTANLVGQDNVYTEAKLKLTAGVVNSSPAFDTLHAPIMYANFGDIYNMSMAAIDPDGDSLVYSLVAPLSSTNTPVSYKPYPNTAGTPFPPGLIMNPYPKPPYSNSTPFTPQLAQLSSSIPTTFSPQFPMPTIMVNWNAAPTIPYPGAPFGGMIWAASNVFEMNPVNGELKFSPSRFVQGATYLSGENRYTISIMVEEFRKINGVMTKLGSVRRETMIELMNNISANPLLASQQANNQAIPAGYEIRLRPGTPLNLNFAGTDPDSNTVTLTTNATYILQGSSFVSTSGTNPTGTITWVPTAADVRWQPYYFQVQFRDDANPLRGIRYETYAVRVSSTGGVTSTPEAFLSSSVSAFPNPFSEELNFNLNLTGKAESMKIYNLLGQQVDEISLQNSGLGEQKVKWRNAAKYAAGTYVAKLITSGRSSQTLKFTKIQ